MLKTFPEIDMRKISVCSPFMFQYYLLFKRNWVFATHSVFVKPISLQPYDVNLWYFKLTLFDLTELKIWNIKGLTTLGCNDIEFRKSEFVATTQFLWVKIKMRAEISKLFTTPTEIVENSNLRITTSSILLSLYLCSLVV